MNPAVLIVDDSLTVRMDLGESFESAGFERILCSSLAEARDALVAHPFDLIVLDVLLPDGNGIDFLRELRTISATASTPVVMLSTEAEIRDRVRGLKTGASEYVGKPYEIAYVVGRSLELLRKTSPAGESRGSTTVLVIDDSATFREELKFVLETAGYRVVAAVSGEDGLRAAVDARPDIIVVDGVLPGIDGATVIRRIRADAAIRATPCILLTASEERSGELEALDAGADAYVRKEEDSQVILARVTAVLRASAAAVFGGGWAGEFTGAEEDSRCRGRRGRSARDRGGAAARRMRSHRERGTVAKRWNYWLCSLWIAFCSE